METTETFDPVLKVDYLRPSRGKVRDRLVWADDQAQQALTEFRRDRLLERLLAAR